jgi:hypothetical protein
MNVYALQKLIGHSDLSILQRYLAQTEQDLQDAHQKASPVDHLLHQIEKRTHPCGPVSMPPM